MQHIAYFIQKYKYFLLFILLEVFAFLLTVQSRSYHKSQFINSANAITGGFFETSNSFFEYTTLKKENLRLAEENTLLRNQLASIPEQIHTIPLDSTLQTNEFITAKVISNNFKKRNNVLTIDKGTNDGLSIDMGVITSHGIIGVINNISSNYATVLSILNSKSKINVKLKRSHYFGTLDWNGKNYRYSQLQDIQRQAPIQIGDTIVSGGKSILFPEGILIGRISDFKINNKNYENIEVELFTDMSNLGYVHVIKNNDKEEIEKLENQND
ncbi:rod shape-determining protein MreC [Flavicella sediminum]|uniref:rod shape-determining protein MreC n=1 Tax=Flavicella sediminum TaxID=2585141 RepID=UPI001121B259|nr:rod shape-determining protein MreC [Flavicella sediminum]